MCEARFPSVPSWEYATSRRNRHTATVIFKSARVRIKFMIILVQNQVERSI
jgi:hypothetical protein